MLVHSAIEKVAYRLPEVRQSETLTVRAQSVDKKAIVTET